MFVYLYCTFAFLVLLVCFIVKLYISSSSRISVVVLFLWHTIIIQFAINEVSRFVSFLFTLLDLSALVPTSYFILLTEYQEENTSEKE